MNKEELKRYVPLMKEAEELREQAEQLEEDIKSLKAVVVDGMPKGSTVNDSIGNLVVRVDKMKRKYLRKYDEALCELYKIERCIEGLDDETERRLMRKRYIEDKHWEDICVDLHYEWAQVHRIHARVLKRIGNDIK